MAQKRDNGMGTIYQRSNGSWVGKIYLGKEPSGKEKFKYLSGKTSGEVKRKIREFNQSGTLEYKQSLPFEEYILSWLRIYKLESIRASSYDRLESTIKNQILPELGSRPIGSINSGDIQMLINRLKSKGLSHSTVKKTYDCLNMIFRHAAYAEDIQKNPMPLVKMPPKALFETKEIRFFDKNECNLIMEEAQRKYKTGKPVYIYGDVYVLILNTGLRMGEAISLRKEDWDKDKKTLHIRRNIQFVSKREDGVKQVGRKAVTNATKTYSGNRVIPLNNTATAALERLCAAHPEVDNIVGDSNGNIIPPERLERTFYRMLNNLKMERCGMHSLRHTFASMLYAAGTDIKTISSLLGHANTQITINTYVHLFREIDHDAVANLYE